MVSTVIKKWDKENWLSSKNYILNFNKFLLKVQFQTTLLIFKDNKEIYRSVGETTKDLLYEAIKGSIKT